MNQDIDYSDYIYEKYVENIAELEKKAVDLKLRENVAFALLEEIEYILINQKYGISTEEISRLTPPVIPPDSRVWRIRFPAICGGFFQRRRLDSRTRRLTF